MVKRIEVSAGTFDYNQPIKDVTLADDGLSATVTLYNPLTHNGKYVITVNGYEEYPLVASLGNPTSMELYAEGANLGVLLTTGNPTPLNVKFYDEKGVEVTPANPTVVYRLETRATDGSYYLAGNKLTIKNEGVVVKVIAEYQGRVENGKRVGQLSASQEFAAVETPATQVGNVVSQTINGKWDSPSTVMRLKDNTKIMQVKFATSDGKTTEGLTNGSEFTVGGIQYKVSFTTVTPQYAVVGSTGLLTAFKTGVAEFYVNLAQKTNTGWGEANPVGFFYVTIEADATFASTVLDKYSLTLGTSEVDESFHKGTITLSAKDSYGDAYPVSGGVTVDCTTDGYEKNAFADAVKVTGYADGKATISVDALAICEAMGDNAPKDGAAAMLYFTTTYNNYTEEFYVLVQTAIGDNYVQISASNDSIDALRITDDNKSAAKDISFEVFYMNNGVKVDKLALAEYPAEAKNISDGTYCYKVTKDGEKVAASLTGNKVSVALSSSEADANGMNVVKYAGAGVYVFELYKCIGSGDEAVLVQEDSSSIGVYLGEAGAYAIAGEPLSTSVAAADAANDDKLVLCFNINDRKGNAIVENGALNGEATCDEYVVTKTPVVDAGFVYVEKITFYENVGTDADPVYVPYVVNVDTVLNVK